MSGVSAKHINSVDELIDEYRVFLIDQYGVLHNGFDPYIGAAESLRKLKRSGAKVIIISNSGKRAAINKQRMLKLGFEEDCFDEIVTSGEVAWHLLKNQFIGSRFQSGANCYFLSNDNDRSAVEGLDLVEVSSLEASELILLTGQHLNQNQLASLCDSLKSALHRNIPCICTNPDKVAYAATGKVFSAGSVAEWYEAEGGEVLWLGKPYAEIYEHIFRTQGIDERTNVVCIGDSIEHDTKGGAALSLVTVLVRTGINDHLNDDELQQLYVEHKVVPDYVLPFF